jgi:hypothetical protein
MKLDFRPKPLAPDANWLDRLEWVGEWLLSKVVWRSERYPVLSGMVTGFGISIGPVLIFVLIVWWNGHRK